MGPVMSVERLTMTLALPINLWLHLRMQPPNMDGKCHIFHSKFLPLLFFFLSLCLYLFCSEVDAGLNADRRLHTYWRLLRVD